MHAMTQLLQKLFVAPFEAFIFATAGLVAFKLVRGDISTRGLLIDRRTGLVSSMQVQQLLVTIAVAGSFLAEIATAQTPRRFPSVSSEMLVLLGGSNGALMLNRSFHRLLDLVRDAVRSDKGSNT